MSLCFIEATQTKRVVAVLTLLVLTGLFALRGPSYVAAQPYYPYGGGLVTGHVLGFDVYDELMPISWATVTASVGSQVVEQASSLGGGYFEMFLPVGFYNLTVEEYGFIPKTMQIFVSSGSSTTLQFVLIQGPRNYTYEVMVSIGGFTSNYYSNLTADGKYEGIIVGGGSRTLTFRIGSTHQVNVDQYVNESGGIRYYCETANRTVSGGDPITFTYQPENYLRVANSMFDFSSVEGWYKRDALVRTPVAPQYLNGSTGVRYVFENWTVDESKVSGNPISISMDKPHNVFANYRTQYYVDVKSDYGNPKGSGWFDANSTVNVSIVSPQGWGVQKVFDKWEGGVNSTSPTISVLIDSPKTLVAVWRDDYRQTYIAIAAAAVVLILVGIFTGLRKKIAKPQSKS